MDDLQAIDFSKLQDQLITLLTDPVSNLQAAMLLYGIIILVVAMVLVVGIALLMNLPDEEIETPQSEPGSVASEDRDESGSKATAAKPVPALPKTARSLSISMGIFAAVLAAVWVLTGFTTAADPVCGACHVATLHDNAEKGQDPHGATSCVSCHESGGLAGRYVTALPSRMVHFVEGASGWTAQAAYGRVTTSACEDCHAEGLASVTVNRESGVRMSHAEPLAAFAMCLDCHEPIESLVTRQTTGMRSCLRCHNSIIASSECSTCHDKKTAAAARASTTAFAKPQVEDVKCGGCHDEKRECDSCHGVRMPHTIAFMAGAHARAGAVNFWFSGGKTCAACHTATRRSCTKCHTPLLGGGHPASQATIHQTATADRCTSCHNGFGLANPSDRDWCELCHSATALRESPR